MATDLEKLMAQMPNLGAEMPTLTGNANPLAAGMAMNAPQPQVPQPPVETFNAATMGAPNFDEPFIIPQAAQAFGDVPVNMPSNPLDPNPQISAPFQRAEQPVDPRGFMERMADATRSDPAPSVGTGKPSPFGGGTAMRSGAEGANTVFKDTIQSAIPLGLPGALPFEAAAPVADASPTQIAPAADVNAGQEQVTLSGTPTSGSGIGTSVVNDVNFLQEGLKQAQAPQPQGLTTAGGQPLAEFLAGGQQLDAQGRMIDPNVDRSSFEQESMLRDQRQEKMLQDRAKSRQDARGGATGELSMADATAMTGGDRDAARALVVQSRQGAGQKPMTRAEELAERKFQAGLAENNRAWETAQADKAAEAAAGVQETQQARQKTVERMDSQLSFLKNSAVEMAGLQDWSTEGFAGWVAEKLPLDTAAAQVNRLATSFQGNAFLRSIIDSKSLGATFGALSDNEGNKITAAETTLMDPKMGNEARMRAAKQIIDTIESAKARAMKEQGGGASNAPRYSDDQDHGEKVETHFQG